MKIVWVLLLFATLVSCVHQKQLKPVRIQTFIYPPYTDSGPSGMFIDLITEAYRTQGLSVKFEFDSMIGAIEKAKRQDNLLLASRMYKAEFAQEIGYEEFYSVNTNILSIKGRENNFKLGTFSSDEVSFAIKNQLTPISYVTPGDGLRLLYDGVVSRIICTDISCDQIKITNPDVNFELVYGYSFPVDMVYFGRVPSRKLVSELALLKKGLKEILENGKYMEIQNSYKVSNPIFQIPLEELSHIKIDK